MNAAELGRLQERSAWRPSSMPPACDAALSRRAIRCRFKPPAGRDAGRWSRMQRRLLASQVAEQQAKLAAIDGQIAQKEAERATISGHRSTSSRPPSRCSRQRVEIRRHLVSKELGSQADLSRGACRT